MKAACDAHAAVAPYEKYKKWCDEYFFLKHRNEMRGIGGIFYDYLEAATGTRTFAFTQDVGRAFLKIYPELVRRNFANALDRGRARGAAGAPRPLCRVQPALRPRHDLRPAHRRQCRFDPVVDAAGGEVAVSVSAISAPNTITRAAEQHHRIEDRGVHMDRQPLDERLGQKRAGKRHDPDQQREGDRLGRDRAGQRRTPTSRDPPMKIESTASVAITAWPARPAAINSDSRMTPAPTVPPTAAP